jgi:hypothetical protein
MAPELREIRATVDKQRMSDLLEMLQTAVAKARATNRYLTFWGD